MFHGIEFGRIARQPLQGQPAALGGNEIAHEGAAMSRQTVPDHPQGPARVPHQVFEKLDDLGRFDGPRKELEVEVPPGDSRHHRKGLPVEMKTEHWGLASGRPGAHPVRPFAQSAFVDEDNGLTSFFGFFLAPASAGASTFGWLRRYLPRRVPPAAAASNPKRAAGARHGPWN